MILIGVHKLCPARRAFCFGQKNSVICNGRQIQALKFNPANSVKRIQTSMSLLIASSGKNLDPWIRALREADPGLEVVTLDQVTDKSAVTFALAWNHPEAVFREFPNLKCISSMGAGVDHLLKDPTIPAQIDIVRILDPTLSQDLFEFAMALIMQRNRTLDQFRENQGNKLWKKKRYTRIQDTRVGVMGIGVIGNHVASELHGLGFQVCGWGRTPKQGSQVNPAEQAGQPQYTRYAGKSQLHAFLEASRCIDLPVATDGGDKGDPEHGEPFQAAARALPDQPGQG
jgi:glyoxylate/hydroxypyruvate reductase